MGTSFFHKLDQEMVIFRGFSKKNFRTKGFQLSFLILIEFPNIFIWKPAKKLKVGVVVGQNLDQIMSNIEKSEEAAIIIRFFSYFTQGITFKEKSSGCKST